MINLFDIPKNDQSVYYLGQIFGYVGTLLPAKDPNQLVGIMFKTLNTVALTIGAFMVVYVTVVGLLKTAQEGEFLGKQWNSLWVPIRTVMGIAALFPTATGYSAIQIIIMWIILQGVGAADTMWTKVILFVKATGNPYAGVDSSDLQTSGTQIEMQKLFQGLMCQASYKATYPDIPITSSTSGGAIQYYCGQTRYGDNFCTGDEKKMLDPAEGPQQIPANPTKVVAGKTVPADTVDYQMGPLSGTSGQCGKLTYCNVAAKCPPLTGTAYDSLECTTCKAQRSALRAIVSTLGALATKLVAIDHEYVNFYETVVTPSTTLPVWVTEFCSALNLTRSQCCVYVPMVDPSIDVSKLPMCESGQFPPDNEAGDYSNTSNKITNPISPSTAATTLYFQYPLATLLNGSDFINASIGEYTTALVAAASKYTQDRMNDPNLSSGDADTDKWQNAAKDFGWILAGGYYFKIAGENREKTNAMYPTLTVVLPDPQPKTFRNNATAVTSILKLMQNASADSSPSFVSPPSYAGDIQDSMGASARGLLTSWKKSLQTNTKGATNPLISMANFGYQMMITAQLLFFVIVTLVTVLTTLSSLNIIALGFGLTENPIGAGLKAALSLVSPFFFLLIGALYSVGATLGIYVPLIPYMIFTLGAIGWLIATIEAMVAGPIIALGILSPGGQHDILGRAEPALMQLLNLFLRPVLMIIGMMLSMIFTVVVVNLVNSGFLAVTTQVISNPGLFEQILFIGAYTSFIVTAVNKACSLIYVIPERVTTWIGGHAVSYGEEQGLGATKSAVEGSAAQTSKTAKASGAKAGDAGETAAKSISAGKDKKDAQEAALTPAPPAAPTSKPGEDEPEG